MSSIPDKHPALPHAVDTPLTREVARILSVRGDDREKALLASDHLEAVVALLPPEELFFTLRELSEDNVPAVLGCAQPAQVQFLLDLELWRKDRLREDRVRPWLQRLAGCGPEALVRWLRGLDLTTWTVLVGNVATVRLREEENDPFQDEPGRAPFTLDGVYYVFADEEMSLLLRDLLIQLRDEDADAYYRLLEAIVRDVDCELEEGAHDEKVRRLGERGFPSWEEAYEVYARLNVKDLDELPRRPGAGAAREDEAPVVAPRYPMASVADAPDLLLRALQRVEAGGGGEAFRAELAYLTNKVLVADGLDPYELDSFARALLKIAGYAAIGLEVLCGPDEEKAARALSEHWLQHLFRVGWTRVRALHTDARGFLTKSWPAGRMERLLFLDSPLPEILDGVLRRHPVWYVGDAEGSPLRDFRSLQEVHVAEKTVRKSDLLGRYLLSVVSFHIEQLREASAHLDLDNLKGSTVFLTAVLNSALDRGFLFAPVDRQTARLGLARIWEVDHPPRRVKPGLADAAVQWAKSVAPTTPEEDVLLREFVRDSFRLLEEEFGHLAEDESPDPRFTKGLWIE